MSLDLNIRNQYNESLDATVQELTRQLQLSSHPYLIGYIGAESDLFEELSRYVQQKMNIADGAVLNREYFDGEHHNYSFRLYDLLKKTEDEVRAKPFQLWLVKVKSFENDNLLLENGSYRYAHDNDQIIYEKSDLGDSLKSSGKKVLVLVQFGHSRGEEIYHNALVSVVQSHFKKFMYIFK